MKSRQSSSLFSSASAFVRLGAKTTASYPMSLVLAQAGSVFSVLGIFFFSRLVRTGPMVAGDYVGYVVVGVAGQGLIGGAFAGVGNELDAAIQQGRLETLLIEPIRWPVIPALLALWPILLAGLQAAATIAIGAALGVHFSIAGLAAALAVAVFASLSGLALGVIAGSVRVLAKRSDPVWLIYSLLSGLVGGVAVPINILPAPLRAISWLFPTMYVDSLLRKLVMPHSSAIYGPSVVVSFAVLAAGLVPLAVAAAGCFGKAVNIGRRLGVLAGY